MITLLYLIVGIVIVCQAITIYSLQVREKKLQAEIDGILADIYSQKQWIKKKSLVNNDICEVYVKSTKDLLDKHYQRY